MNVKYRGTIVRSQCLVMRFVFVAAGHAIGLLDLPERVTILPQVFQAIAMQHYPLRRLGL